MMIKLVRFKKTICNHIQITKQAFVTICLMCATELIQGQQVIHKDPFDIKKTNVSGFLFMRPMSVGTAGPQLRITHYVTPRFMIMFNGYFGLVTEGGFEWGPAQPNQGFRLGSFEADLHLVDRSKNKRLNIYIPLDRTDTAIQGTAYAKFESSVRRILCFTTGIQLMKDRQKITSKRDERAETNQVPMIDMNTGSDTIFKYARISTNTSYTNVLIGIKFKSISATAVKYKDGNSMNDRHIEIYLSLIIPVSYHYHKDLYNSFFSQGPTHRLHEYKPKTGFKAGLFNRNSIRSNWSFGIECGVQPTISPRYLNGTFIHLSIGFSLNFGKIKYINP